MNRLNAKRIGVLAASLLFGLAVAGPVSFSNIPIINSAGQPVVQIVVGSNAQPSDGVVAANIAAVIGNLAFTSQPVTATVQGTSGLSCVVTTATCSVSGQQVWLGEAGVAAPAGSYGFTALIGSVLNRGITLGSPSNTKFLATTSTYGSQQGFTTTNSPPDSPYTAAGYVPTSTSVTASNNGGGVSFTSFTSGHIDNLMVVSNSQLPALLSNAGSYGESEYLFLTGFPVYNQQTSPSVKSFAVIDAGGAYEALFNHPIHEPYYTTGNSVNNAAITLLGQNWTIVSYTLPSGTATSSTVAQHGGKLGLASSLVPLTTVYVGKNLTSGPFTVQLADLGTANSAGVSPAAINVYYKGALTNSSSVYPGNTVKYNVSGTLLWVKVNQTFAGLYAYQKWAKIQMYSGLYNITDGGVFNQTRDPGWNINLLWTNTTGAGKQLTDLAGIILYNTTPVMLTPGQSFTFIQNPKVYKVTLTGDTLGNNFDALTVSSQYASSVDYANSPGAVGSGLGNINNITEPAQELVVTSSIPNAFNDGGFTGSSAVYDLTPYTLKELNTTGTAVGAPVNVLLQISAGYPTANYISNTNPLVVTISGYPSSTSGSATSTSLSFTSNSFGFNALSTSGNFYNITAIKLNRALPGLIVSVNSSGASGSATFSGNAPYTNTIVAGNVPVLSQQTSGTATTVVTGNIVLATSVSGVNSISFSNTVASGGTIGISGNVAITSANVVNAISSTNPFTLSGNLIVANTVFPLFSGGKVIGNVIVSGNVLVQNNNIAVTANTATVNTFSAASGFLTVTANVPLSGPITISGNIMLTANIPTATTVTTGPEGIVTFAPTNVIITSGSTGSGAGIAKLISGTTPQILYGPLAGKSYYSTVSGASVIYNQQNGQPTTNFAISNMNPVAVAGTGPQFAFFTYTTSEIDVPSNTQSQDQFAFNILNSTAGVAATPLFQLNYSATNTQNNVTYTSSTGNSVNAQAGFVSERGSKVAAIGPTSLTFDLAENVDSLQLVVGPVNSTVSTAKKVVGPYSIGQSTNLPNVTIANITAKCSVGASGSGCSVSGIGNLTATPSVSSATTPVSLNTAATPLVVLDSNANQASTLIVIGSKFVNSVAAQIFAQNPSLASSFNTGSVIVQAFGSNRILVAGYYANQTVQAGNQFIQALLSSA
jgi:lipopolysaccharide export system protein LptA